MSSQLNVGQLLIEESIDAEVADVVIDGARAMYTLEFMTKIQSGEVELVFHKPESPI